jgi:serine/threonine-protein kinase HipA
MLKKPGQEDFCQALGIVSKNKYQKENGPLLKQCFALLCEVSSAPVLDLTRLMDAVIFNFLVGNNDAHGKDFSLLCRSAGTVSLETRLAPLYDVVSTRYYPELARELAMKIGGKYSSDRVSKTNFEQLAEDAGLAKPLVRSRVPELAEAAFSNLDKTGIEHPVVDTLTVQIRERCGTIRERFGK